MGGLVGVAVSLGLLLHPGSDQKKEEPTIVEGKLGTESHRVIWKGHPDEYIEKTLLKSKIEDEGIPQAPLFHPPSVFLELEESIKHPDTPHYKAFYEKKLMPRLFHKEGLPMIIGKIDTYTGDKENEHTMFSMGFRHNGKAGYYPTYEEYEELWGTVLEVNFFTYWEAMHNCGVPGYINPFGWYDHPKPDRYESGEEILGAATPEDVRLMLKAFGMFAIEYNLYQHINKRTDFKVLKVCGKVVPMDPTRSPWSCRDYKAWGSNQIHGKDAPFHTMEQAIIWQNWGNEHDKVRFRKKYKTRLKKEYTQPDTVDTDRPKIHEDKRYFPMLNKFPKRIMSQYVTPVIVWDYNQIPGKTHEAVKNRYEEIKAMLVDHTIPLDKEGMRFPNLQEHEIIGGWGNKDKTIPNLDHYHFLLETRKDPRVPGGYEHTEITKKCIELYKKNKRCPEDYQEHIRMEADSVRRKKLAERIRRGSPARDDKLVPDSNGSGPWLPHLRTIEEEEEKDPMLSDNRDCDEKEPELKEEDEGYPISDPIY